MFIESVALSIISDSKKSESSARSRKILGYRTSETFQISVEKATGFRYKYRGHPAQYWKDSKPSQYL